MVKVTLYRLTHLPASTFLMRKLFRCLAMVITTPGQTSSISGGSTFVNTKGRQIRARLVPRVRTRMTTYRQSRIRRHQTIKEINNGRS